LVISICFFSSEEVEPGGANGVDSPFPDFAETHFTGISRLDFKYGSAANAITDETEREVRPVKIED
jgi:hypothetical protein